MDRRRLGQGTFLAAGIRALLFVGLVTLSGCATGANAAAAGDELLGITRGLFCAGAQSLLLSLWNVHDESTSRFMQLFYGRIADGAMPVSALRDTMIDVRAGVDEVDRELVALLVRRFGYMDAAARITEEYLQAEATDPFLGVKERRVTPATVSAVAATWAARPISSGANRRVRPMPIASRLPPPAGGAGASSRVNTSRCGDSPPSVPPDMTIATRRSMSPGGQFRCSASSSLSARVA